MIHSSEKDFEREAEKTLQWLDNRLSSLELESDYQNGILSIEFSEGSKYIVNSHRAARQIWMAAESSAWHFDFIPETKRWIASKNGCDLVETVEEVVGRKLGKEIHF